jgi:hypothetical protein
MSGTSVSVGVVMRASWSSALLSGVLLFLTPTLVLAQTQPPGQSSPGESPASEASLPPPSKSHAPRMSRETRLQIIRDFETQLFYARTAFPLGMKGLKLKDGVVSPNGEKMRQELAMWGPAIRAGDPAHISFVQIKEDHIHFEINGGPVRRKKWYQRVEVSGTGGVPVTSGANETIDNPHGSFVDLCFDHYVPELTAREVRDLLTPVLDFKAQNKEEAYLDTLPPKIKAAIQAHHVLVGMTPEMVLHAKGKPPKKVREKDGETDYEEWIYGEPPQDVDFVRIVGEEVVRVETMKVGGEKIVRTEREVILDKPEKEAKQEPSEPKPNAPSLRRPGEPSEDVPNPADGTNPVPPMAPPQSPSGPGPGAPFLASFARSGVLGSIPNPHL